MHCLRLPKFWLVGLLSLLGELSMATIAPAEDPKPVCGDAENAIPENRQFLEFIRAQAHAARKDDSPPKSKEEWLQRKALLRQKLEEAWGGFPKTPCPLEPKILGTLDRDSYTVERLIFQTMPGVWMTANAYVPKSPGKHPALLSVHGHWAGAKQDPTVQKRCIGPVKLGYFVLAVDAFGAGERGISKNLGEYHGEMVGAMLLPTGRPLSGIQVYENTRAIDYLLTRPEVDAERIAVTGASGGGNQSMYIGAWDERLRAAVPVCSVGNYQSYLGQACCMCEVVPGALRFTEESGILSLTAPRALMVVNATRDAIQFSVAESNKSLALTEPVYQLLDRPHSLKHAIFEGPHDYSQPMREALYGWLSLHLRGEGDGSPIPDPPMETEQPETLRCYPGDTRPNDWMTVPRFAAAEAGRCPDHWPSVTTTADWNAAARSLRKQLETSLGGFPARVPLELRAIPAKADQPAALTQFRVTTEPGLCMTCSLHAATVPSGSRKVAILLDLEHPEAVDDPWLISLQKAGWDVLQPSLRATGRFAWPGDRVGRAPDHNTAEWSLWLGRPLWGQWTWDVQRAIDALDELDGKLPQQLAVIGRGPAGLIALTAAATDARISGAVSANALSSLVSNVPFVNQRLSMMVPGLLRDVGDIPLLITLTAPRRVVIAGGVTADGQAKSEVELKQDLKRAITFFEEIGQPSSLSVRSTATIEQILSDLEKSP